MCSLKTTKKELDKTKQFRADSKLFAEQMKDSENFTSEKNAATATK